MAIPLTCPGCHIVFDVPDELVGKTIRCTTCATQMTVAALTGAAKKPFGWASKSGEAPPAAPAPMATGEVLPDDEPVTPAAAKTAPAPAKAKPRKSVFDDPGEDATDDEPPAKAKSEPEKKAKVAAAATTAAGFKGGKPAAKKKGDTWKEAEEDDDDDDDDKPKKKKKGGAAGPPVALIAGGVVALLAIVGLAAWLLMGNSKKPDTAGTSGGSTPANTTPVGSPPTAPAGSPLATATWQPVKIGTFACEMPGTPSQRNEMSPGGVNVQLQMLEGPAKDYAFFVTTVPLPASIPPSMVPKLLNDAANGAEQGMTRGGGFGGGGFGRSNVIRVSSKTDITQDGLPGKELQLSGTAGNEAKGGVVRIVLAGREMHMFGAAGDNRGALQPHIQRFMASVKLTKPSTDPGGVAIGQPSRPPVGQPPVPQPPSGQPPIGQPPIGQPPVTNPPVPPVPPVAPNGEVVGNLKAKLGNPFFAGAFDTEKKELLVVTLRTLQGVRQAGAIQRYSYPDFKFIASVNIASVGTRAAVDSEKGLLYVTTAGGPSASLAVLAQNQFDRNAYQGDVAVYDLAQLRGDKLDAKTDLKPVATIPVSKVIRDISLSADGKSLFVLANSTLGKLPRSQVLQVNTGDRKVAKTIDLPTPGWDMVASPDGQKLFVTGLALGATVPPLMVIDLTTVTLAPPLTLPRAAYNVAVAKDGRVLASTIPPAGGGGGVFGGVPPVPGGGIGGPANACELNAIDAKGDRAEVLRPGLAGVSNSGYVGFTPDGKYLICSSHHPLATGAGVDVYETSDKFLGDKKVASVKKAGEAHLGGTFLVSPDGEYAVFHNGAVLKLDDLGSTPAPAPGGVGGIGGVGGVGGFPLPGK
ncbi:YncE family protein [Gemmata sp.]|uniref:YncE family protein n=1 Tax=Gemmata sp. TaxID=1914242 RepID=UPI003F70BFBE